MAGCAAFLAAFAWHREEGPRPRRRLWDAVNLGGTAVAATLVWVVIRRLTRTSDVEPYPWAVVDRLALPQVLENLGAFVYPWSTGTARGFAILLTVAVFGVAGWLVLSRDTAAVQRNLAIGLLASAALAPIALVVMNWVVTRYYVPTQGRYGLSLVPLAVALAASQVRARWLQITARGRLARGVLAGVAVRPLARRLLATARPHPPVVVPVLECSWPASSSSEPASSASPSPHVWLGAATTSWSSRRSTGSPRTRPGRNSGVIHSGRLLRARQPQGDGCAGPAAGPWWSSAASTTCRRGVRQARSSPPTRQSCPGCTGVHERAARQRHAGPAARRAPRRASTSRTSTAVAALHVAEHRHRRLPRRSATLADLAAGRASDPARGPGDRGGRAAGRVWSCRRRPATSGATCWSTAPACTPTGSRGSRASATAPASSRSAASTSRCAPIGATWCAGSSTRCPTRGSRSSGCT